MSSTKEEPTNLNATRKQREGPRSWISLVRVRG